MSPASRKTTKANGCGQTALSSIFCPNFIDARHSMAEENDGKLTTPSTSASSSPSLSSSLSPILPSLPSLMKSSPPSDCIWFAPASMKSLRTHNPIRAIIDPIMASSTKSGKDRGDGKDQISLALGDPTAYGNIEPCPVIISAITKAIQSPSIAAGYVNACGTPEARAAIAAYHSNQSLENIKVAPDDVIVANGASGALELALTALLDEDTVILVPRPGFPLYQVIAESHGARVVQYDLLPESRWECDLNHIESIILREEQDGLQQHENKNPVVRGIVVNNPSNPTGAVYSELHLMEIVHLAQKYHIPIISDEIYGDMTFAGELFRPMADIAARMGNKVPVITASGLGKQYVVPGWRIGWIMFYDSNNGAIKEVKKGAQRLAQVILGASHLAQVAIPAVLAPSSEADRVAIVAWKDNLNSTIEKQAKLLCDLLNECYGLDVIYPQGAMYAMARIQVDMFTDAIRDDVTFMKILLEEENIVVLPGRAFGLSDTFDIKPSCYVFRVVFCAPENILRDAAERICLFCHRHSKK